MPAHQLSGAGPADSPRLAAIHAAAFPPAEAWGPDVFSLQLTLPNVTAVTDAANGLVMLRVAGDEAEILTLAVRPEARRRRLGSALLQEAIVNAAAAGAGVLFLEVSTKNTAALALYREFGFTQAGFRPRYYSDGSDALVLRLELTTPAA